MASIIAEEREARAPSPARAPRLINGYWNSLRINWLLWLAIDND